MEKKVCKCGHSDIIHEYYTDTCHAKGCSCLSFQEPNSNPPSPEMVCPNCEGFGHWLLASMGTAKVCPKCNGTGKVPSPEPPEKVRMVEEFLLTDAECNKACEDAHLSPFATPYQERAVFLRAQVRKAYPIIDSLAYCRGYNEATAEARQQAQGELSGWIRCPHCGSGAIIWGKDRILLECTNCGNKLQELSKE